MKICRLMHEVEKIKEETNLSFEATEKIKRIICGSHNGVCKDKYLADLDDSELIGMAEERLLEDDGTRYTTEDILRMREGNRADGINLNEVLSKENLGKKFICQENGCTVMNNGQTLIFLHSEFNNGDGVWRDAHVSHIWVNSKYTPIEGK